MPIGRLWLKKSQKYIKIQDYFTAVFENTVDFTALSNDSLPREGFSL
jgi:hypothetical protein